MQAVCVCVYVRESERLCLWCVCVCVCARARVWGVCVAPYVHRACVCVCGGVCVHLASRGHICRVLAQGVQATAALSLSVFVRLYKYSK